MNMLSFLKQSKKFVNAKDPVFIILGNEACDLDSAVSALSLAFLYQKHRKGHPLLPADLKHYLPVLNIERRDYPLKTEVKYLLCSHCITEDLLIFRDDLHENFIAKNYFILVDHHFSPYLQKSIEIFDHRPRDKNVIFAKDCKINMDIVGSCSTLISEYAIEQSKNIKIDCEDLPVLNMLRSTIILDTVNFSKAAGRSTPRDEIACLQLEEILNSQKRIMRTREAELDCLVKARSDIGKLTTSQLLRKDFKMLSTNKKCIALPGFPLTVQEFIKKPKAHEAIKEFAHNMKCSVIVLLGMYIDPKDNSVHRDIGLIDLHGGTPLSADIQKSLLETKDPDLQLKYYSECRFMGGHFYLQNNIKATRKHILPIIKNILDQLNFIE